MKYNGLTIGVPKEILAGERRVSAVPETVAAFVEQGRPGCWWRREQERVRFRR